jgi:hypothetical protein
MDRGEVKLKLVPSGRTAALEILKATKPEFAAVAQMTIAQPAGSRRKASCQKPAQAIYPLRRFVSPLTTFGRLSCGLTIFEMLSVP